MGQCANLPQATRGSRLPSRDRRAPRTTHLMAKQAAATPATSWMIEVTPRGCRTFHSVAARHRFVGSRSAILGSLV